MKKVFLHSCFTKCLKCREIYSRTGNSKLVEINKINLQRDWAENFYFVIISLLMIWSQGLLNLLVTLLINRKLWSFEQNLSCPKVDLSESKRNTSLANSLLLFRSREARFWTRFWSGRGERLWIWSETWDDGNTTNGDEDRSWCPDQ